LNQNPNLETAHRGDLKNVFSTDIGVEPSSQILDNRQGCLRVECRPHDGKKRHQQFGGVPTNAELLRTTGSGLCQGLESPATLSVACGLAERFLKSKAFFPPSTRPCRMIFPSPISATDFAMDSLKFDYSPLLVVAKRKSRSAGQRGENQI
jgi:hypothetical protein